jgi:hypothetical protein
VGDTNYTAAGGLTNIGQTPYTPVDGDGVPVEMHGLMVGASSAADATGLIAITMAGGGRMIVPVTCPAGYSMRIFDGLVFRSIDAETTFTGKIWPLV